MYIQEVLEGAFRPRLALIDILSQQEEELQAKISRLQPSLRHQDVQIPQDAQVWACHQSEGGSCLCGL